MQMTITGSAVPPFAGMYLAAHCTQVGTHRENTMKLTSPLNWLRGAAQPADGSEQADAADMGTAFGLDASLRDLPDPSPRKQPMKTDGPRLSRRTGLPRRD